MPIDASKKLDPKYAAERADALASCGAAIQQFSDTPLANTVAKSNMLSEQSWLNDTEDMTKSVEQVRQTIRNVEAQIAKGAGSEKEAAARRVGRCLYQRRLAQLEGSPLATGAVDGILTPLSIGGSNEPPPPGKDAHIIASNGKSAKDCVFLETIASGDSNMSGAVKGRVLVNRCSDEVEIGWCYDPGDCDTETGSSWTIQPGRSWPIKAEWEVRWAACHGANTTSFVKYSHGLRYYCKAPTNK